jgi:hypothetical protein
MPTSELEQIDRQYLQQLYDYTKGDGSVQASMYEIGEAVGLDRDASSQVAQTLIGLNYVEIKTLSGGVGISHEGIAAIEGAGGAAAATAEVSRGLSNKKILSPTDLEAIDQVCGFLKKEAGALGLEFDDLTELIADLRTIDAQLVSSRPKTEIVRACFRSIAAIMDAKDHKEACRRLRELTGE